MCWGPTPIPAPLTPCWCAPPADTGRAAKQPTLLSPVPQYQQNWGVDVGGKAQTPGLHDGLWLIRACIDFSFRICTKPDLIKPLSLHQSSCAMSSIEHHSPTGAQPGSGRLGDWGVCKACPLRKVLASCFSGGGRGVGCSFSVYYLVTHFVPEVEESGKIHPPPNKRAFSRCLLQALKGGLQKHTAPSCCKDFEHRQLVEGSWDRSEIPVSKLWVCVLEQQDWRLPWAGSGFSNAPMCIVQVCFLREGHPKSTFSFYFAHKFSPGLAFIFSAIYRVLFQVRWGSKNQVPCTVVSLGHRMQRFIVRGGYPFPVWIFSVNVSVTLCERLMQIALPQSQSLQRK